MLNIVAMAAIAIVVALVAVLAYAASRPETFRIQRTATMKAPPERIFPFIDDLRAHTSWSPFEKDPAMKRAHSGAARGKGAVYEWEGNRQVGAGRIAITDSTPAKITMTLDMLRPFEAHNVVEFALEPNGDAKAVGADIATNVSWAMQGRQPYMAKLFGTFVNCDRMVGRQFEEGLGKLKALVEA